MGVGGSGPARSSGLLGGGSKVGPRLAVESMQSVQATSLLPRAPPLLPPLEVFTHLAPTLGSPSLPSPRSAAAAAAQHVAPAR